MSKPVMKHKKPEWRNVALAVRQPWASLICYGIKDLENRSWATDYRGRIFIVASKTNIASQFDSFPKKIQREINKHLENETFPELETLPTSAVIGYVDLVDCCLEPVKNIWSNNGGWEVYNVNWMLENAYLFDEPQLVGFKAKLNLFEIPELDPDNLPPAHKVKL